MMQDHTTARRKGGTQAMLMIPHVSCFCSIVESRYPNMMNSLVEL